MYDEIEYHTSDPKIEATTSQIRKQFHETIQELKYKGHLIENIEAFLVNTEDMHSLHLLFSDSKNVPGGPFDGQMRMYGVKIIESEYVPKGTIFKVFKNEDQMLHPVAPIPIPGSIQYPPGTIISGLIPNLGYSKEQMEDAMLPMTTAIDDDHPVTTEDIKENMAKAIEAVNKVLDEPVPKGNVPSKEKRHSTKRRIELDK